MIASEDHNPEPLHPRSAPTQAPPPMPTSPSPRTLEDVRRQAMETIITINDPEPLITTEHGGIKILSTGPAVEKAEGPKPIKIKIPLKDASSKKLFEKLKAIHPDIRDAIDLTVKLGVIAFEESMELTTDFELKKTDPVMTFKLINRPGHRYTRNVMLPRNIDLIQDLIRILSDINAPK